MCPSVTFFSVNSVVNYGKCKMENGQDSALALLAVRSVPKGSTDGTMEKSL